MLPDSPGKTCKASLILPGSLESPSRKGRAFCFVRVLVTVRFAD